MYIHIIYNFYSHIKILYMNKNFYKTFVIIINFKLKFTSLKIVMLLLSEGISANFT